MLSMTAAVQVADYAVQHVSLSHHATGLKAGSVRVMPCAFTKQEVTGQLVSLSGPCPRDCFASPWRRDTSRRECSWLWWGIVQHLYLWWSLAFQRNSVEKRQEGGKMEWLQVTCCLYIYMWLTLMQMKENLSVENPYTQLSNQSPALERSERNSFAMKSTISEGFFF